MTLQEAPNASSGVEALELVPLGLLKLVHFLLAHSHHKVVCMFSITVTLWQRSLVHAHGRVVTQGTPLAVVGLSSVR